MLTVTSPHKAVEYFENKLEFTIDPIGLNEAIKNGEVNVIDVRDEKDFGKRTSAHGNKPSEREVEHL